MRTAQATIGVAAYAVILAVYLIVFEKELWTRFFARKK